MINDKLNGFEELAETIAPVPPALELDTEKYLTEIEEFEMTETQKLEFLQTLWSIMRTFVELGFSGDICERIFENAAFDDSGAADAVKSLTLKESGDDR